MLRSCASSTTRLLTRSRFLDARRAYQRVPLDQPLPGLQELQYSDHKEIDPFNATITTLENGLRIASEPHFGEFCTIAVAIDSGARYEIQYPLGTSHFIEKIAYAASENFKSGEARHQLLEKHGAIVDCQSTRDTFIYAASCHVKGVDEIMQLIADTVLRPCILPEELQYAQLNIASENAHLNRNPECEPLLTDWVHEAAFRGNTLGLSKYCKDEGITAINREHLFSYLKQHHTPQRMVVAGVGVEHDALVAATKKHFDMSTSSWNKDSSILLPEIPEIDNSLAQYTGGEKRVERDLSEKGLGPSQYPNLAHVVLGFESCGYKDADFVPFCVLQSLMGGGTSFSAGGPGKGMFTRLYVDVLNQYHFMFNATSYNHSYADAGVFCISASSDPSLIRETSQIIANEFFRLVEGVHDEELMRAKIQLKSQLMMNLEVRPVMVEDLARQVIGHGYRRKPQEYLDLIDQVTAEDINRVSERMLVSKPAVVGYGDLRNFPSFKQFDKAVATRDFKELNKPSVFSKIIS
uniref:Mitochondrial-processing peptidase subunit alpha n=1 Tax=Steinernema glaseri TaxID=37863 RepID=A0A1I7YJ78_9BILA